MAVEWLDVVLICTSIVASYLVSQRRIAKGEAGRITPRDSPPPSPRQARQSDRGDSGPSDAGNSAFILPSFIHHARMLPVESTHAFRYPTLYLAVPLKELEAGRCDVGAQGRIFRWCKGQDHKRTAVTALEASDYLAATAAGDQASPGSLSSSWLSKLTTELRSRQWLNDDETLDDDEYESWAVTMPSFLGYHGINPLTVYYIYKRNGTPPTSSLPSPDTKVHRGALWLCILEVHNTFGERHMYVLPPGIGEDTEQKSDSTATRERGSGGGGGDPGDDAAAGDGLSWVVRNRRSNYEYQWTFPRSFHVSPFNDRGGYYRLCLKDLWRPSGATTTALPTLDVRLLLMEPQSQEDPVGAQEGKRGGNAQPLLRKKVLATLSSFDHQSHRRPQTLTAGHLMGALSRQPLDLLLTFVRIAWQAAKLHYGRPRLDVYNKPELSVASSRALANGAPSTVASSEQSLPAFDGIGWPPSENSTQLERLLSTSPRAAEATEISDRNGSLMWSEPSASDSEAKRRFERMVKASRTAVRLVSSAGTDETIVPLREPTATLTIFLLTPSFYSDVLLYAHARLALLLGSRVGRRWGVSDAELFVRLFEDPEPSDVCAERQRSLRARAAVWVRERHARWANALAHPHSLGDDVITDASQLDVALPPSWSLVVSLWTLHIGMVLQELAFRVLRARYVPGTEPWMEWRRGAILLAADGQSDAEQNSPSSEHRPEFR
ncbi:unnamed protein product [Parajaminaea phylloscopi]